MSFQTDRNPSPPPEILDNDQLLPDKIGNTVYSKKWVIKTLLKMLEVCGISDITNDSVENNDLSVSSIEELDPKVEEDLCNLWDMSISEEVAKFLFDADICELFLVVVEKTTSPRLLEIMIGIIANMCTFDELCQIISREKRLVQQIVTLSGTTDTPSLQQVIRLITTGVRNESIENLWFHAFNDSEFFMQNVRDIFSNSLNSPLVEKTFELLLIILHKNYSYVKFWSEDDFFDSIIIAGQLLLRGPDPYPCNKETNKVCLDTFFSVICALFQYKPLVDKCVLVWDLLKPLFYKYVEAIGKEEYLLDATRMQSVYYYFKAYNALLNSENMKQVSVITGEVYLRHLSGIYKSVVNLISKVTESTTDVAKGNNMLRWEEESNGEIVVHFIDPSEFEVWNWLEEIIIKTVKCYQNVVEKESEKIIIDDILNIKSAN